VNDTHTTSVLRRFALTLAVMDGGLILAYLALGENRSLPTASVAAVLVFVVAFVAVLMIREGGWNLVRLADDWAEPFTPRFQSVARIGAYLFMAGVLLAAFYITWVLLTRAVPARAV
jgi:lipopolysaccharide export LptBFGC system permease protein LptF